MMCQGCSLKENREECPCLLVLDFAEVDEAVSSGNMFLSSENGFMFVEELDEADLRKGVDVPVPRERIDVGVWSADGWDFDGGGLDIPVGEDCPAVYFHVSSVEAEGEMVREEVRMRKNHCVMSISLSDFGSKPVRIAVLGNVDGYMGDGSPSFGEFSFEMDLEGGEGKRVILPRQADDSLVLEVHDDIGVVRRFSIGEYIAESGYDWNEPDLKDITLEMDVAVTGIKLLVQSCEKTFEFEIEI